MKILFDENMPRPFRRHLTGHSVSTVQDMGWAGVKNGSLLALAETQNFDALLTFDRNLEYKQDLTGRAIAVVVLTCLDKRVSALLPLVPELLRVLAVVQTGGVYQVDLPPPEL